MKMNEVFPSRFLKAEDLDGDMTVVVKKVDMETVIDPSTGGEIQKPVAYFEGLQKGLILNKTNFKTLVNITKQEDSDNWAGTRCVLTTIDVPAFGDIVSAIRIKPVITPK